MFGLLLIAPFNVGFNGILVLVSDVVLGGIAPAIVGAVGLVFIARLWFAVPLVRAAQERTRSPARTRSVVVDSEWPIVSRSVATERPAVRTGGAIRSAARCDRPVANPPAREAHRWIRRNATARRGAG